MHVPLCFLLNKRYICEKKVDGMGKVHRNTRKMSLIIQEIVEANYEPGRQDRSKEWVYRSIVQHIYPMSRRTFYRHLQRAKETESNPPMPRQRSLFD